MSNEEAGETLTPAEEAELADHLDHGPHVFRRIHTRLHANRMTSLITKVVVTCIGAAVIVAGLVMMVTPGPGIVGIILGLAILSAEWEWAERWVDRARAYARDAAEKARGLDPAVRRRRIVLTTLAGALVIGSAVAYVMFYDWPGFAVSAWNWVQGLSGAVPELPGM